MVAFYFDSQIHGFDRKLVIVDFATTIFFDVGRNNFRQVRL